VRLGILAKDQTLPTATPRGLMDTTMIEMTGTTDRMARAEAVGNRRGELADQSALFYDQARGHKAISTAQESEEPRSNAS